MKPRLLTNPRMPRDQLLTLDQLPYLADHTWLTTSGSQQLKYVALSREAIAHSAAAVNERISSDASDVWIHALPRFHVGGVSIEIRAELSGARVVYLEKWDPHAFVKLTQENRGTLSALVPTQLYDLLNFNAPPTLRMVIVGGDALPLPLYLSAKKKGWPIAPTYGMTECSSQVALASLDSPDLLPLSHVEVAIQETVTLKSQSLLTGYAFQKEGRVVFEDPKVEGVFTTTDKGKWNGEALEIVGRKQGLIKIGGENVNLDHLNQILRELTEDGVLIAAKDERLGRKILLLTPIPCDDLVQKFNARVAPYEKIRDTLKI